MKCNATIAVVGKIMAYETCGVPKYWSGFATGNELLYYKIHTESKFESCPEMVWLVHGCANHATEGKCFCPPSAAVT